MRPFKTALAAVFSASLLFSSPANADPVPWSDLTRPQKFLLSDHKPRWRVYSEGIQKKLLRDTNKKIQILQRYKYWINRHLSKKEKLALKKAYRTKTRKQFRNHMDRLIKKYGGWPEKSRS